MTTTTIENLANKEDLASPDFAIQEELRLNIIPQFIRDVYEVVGPTFSAFKAASLSVVQGDTAIDLPTDFSRFEEVRLVEASGLMAGKPLGYIGDRADWIIGAQNATTQVAPRGYYVQRDTGNDVWQLRLSAPSDASYTIRYVYRWAIPYLEGADDPLAEVDLDDYIPTDKQFGIVLALRAVIAEDRYGAEDPRPGRFEKRYQRWIESLYNEPHAAPSGNKEVYVS